MKATVLDGSYVGDDSLASVRQEIVDALALHGATTVIPLRDVHIRHCNGCFGCWLKIPGMCVIKDAGRDVAGAVIQSDLVVFLTPIVFGGYSSELKKAVDRFALSMLLPFFVRMHGETHHPPRYSHRPRLLGIGWLSHPDAESERIFTALVHDNAINLHAPASASAVVYAGQSPERTQAQVQALLKTVEVHP